MVFTPAEEVQSTLVVAWEQVEKAARDFFGEERVEKPSMATPSEALAVAVVLRDGEQEVEAEGGTLVEAVEMIYLTPVEEGEGLSITEQTNRTNVVITKLAMVR